MMSKQYRILMSAFKIYLVIWVSSFFWLGAYGERGDSCRKIISRIGLDVRPSFAFSSYKDDVLVGMLDLDNALNTKIATSLHLKYSFSFASSTPQGRYYPGVWQGIGVAANFLGNPKGIGTPISLYAFIVAPEYKFN